MHQSYHKHGPLLLFFFGNINTVHSLTSILHLNSSLSQKTTREVCAASGSRSSTLTEDRSSLTSSFKHCPRIDKLLHRPDRWTGPNAGVHV